MILKYNIFPRASTCSKALAMALLLSPVWQMNAHANSSANAEQSSTDAQATTQPASYIRVTAESLPELFGKMITFDGNHVVIQEDGSFTGSWSNNPMTGTWVMEDDFFCGTITAFFRPELVGASDCQLLEIKGNKLRATREEGEGVRFVLDIN